MVNFEFDESRVTINDTCICTINHLETERHRIHLTSSLSTISMSPNNAILGSNTLSAGILSYSPCIGVIDSTVHRFLSFGNEGRLVFFLCRYFSETGLWMEPPGQVLDLPENSSRLGTNTLDWEQGRRERMTKLVISFDISSAGTGPGRWNELSVGGKRGENSSTPVVELHSLSSNFSQGRKLQFPRIESLILTTSISPSQDATANSNFTNCNIVSLHHCNSTIKYLKTPSPTHPRNSTGAASK